MRKVLINDLKAGDYIRGWVLSCEMCGAKFMGRCDAKWCSEACRQQARRPKCQTV